MTVNPYDNKVTTQQYIDNCLALQKAIESGTVYKTEFKGNKIQSESLPWRIAHTVEHALRNIFEHEAVLKEDESRKKNLIELVSYLQINEKETEKIKVLSVKNLIRLETITSNKNLINKYTDHSLGYTTGDEKIDSFIGLEKSPVDEDQLRIAQYFVSGSFKDLNLDGLHDEFKKTHRSKTPNIENETLQPTAYQLRTALVLIRNRLHIKKETLNKETLNSEDRRFFARVAQYIMCGPENIKKIPFPSDNFTFECSDFTKIESNNLKLPYNSPFSTKNTTQEAFKSSLTESINSIMSFEELDALHTEFKNKKLGSYEPINGDTIKANANYLKKAFQLTLDHILPHFPTPLTDENRLILARMTQYIMCGSENINKIPFPKDEHCFMCSDLPNLPIELRIDPKSLKFLQNIDDKFNITKIRNDFITNAGAVEINGKELFPTQKQLEEAFELTVDNILPHFPTPLTDENRLILARMTQYIMCGPENINKIPFPKDEFCFTCKELQVLQATAIDLPTPFKSCMETGDLKARISEFFIDINRCTRTFASQSYDHPNEEEIAGLFKAIKADFLDQLKNPEKREAWIKHNEAIAKTANIPNDLDENAFKLLLNGEHQKVNGEYQKESFAEVIIANSFFDDNEIPNDQKQNKEIWNQALRSRMIQVMVFSQQGTLSMLQDPLDIINKCFSEETIETILPDTTHSVYEVHPKQQIARLQKPYSLMVEENSINGNVPFKTADNEDFFINEKFTKKINGQDRIPFISVEQCVEFTGLPDDPKGTLINHKNIRVAIQSGPILDEIITAFKDPS